ncbi:MAG: SLC13 family permease, partial [Alphaproteobacteria bacterium]
LSFIMPSAMGRVVMMLPLLVALASRLGFAKGSKAYTGLLLAGVLGTYLPAFAILPANVPNMVLAGTIEALQDKAPVFGEYLLLHFPILGAAKAVLLVGLLTLLFRDKPQTPDARAGDEPLPPMSSGERRLTILLVAALALWLTDFLHHISPAWIGMAVAILLLLPNNGMLPPKSFPKANLAPVIYVAGIISLGAVVNATGIGKLAADMFLSFLPLEEATDFGAFGILAAISALVGLVTTLPGAPAVISPLSESFAASSGLSLNAVFMTQVIGFSTVLLPYQAPPLVVAMQTASIGFKDMTRVCLAMAAATILLLWPLDFLWWQILGLI